jgi:hypothetical protein
VVLVVVAVGVWFIVGHHGGGSAHAAGRSVSPTVSSPSHAVRTTSAGKSSARSASNAPAGSGGGVPSSGPASDAALPDATPVRCPKATVTVSSAAQLIHAVGIVRPGAVISLADGTYTGNFTATTSGTAAQPIWLCGGPGAVLDGANYKVGYVLHLDKASYWRIVGLSVRDAQKGVVLDSSSHSVLQGLVVTDVGDEGIHLRAASSFDVVTMNTVARTGKLNGKFGEGIYVGSARKNWPKYGAGGGPDRSDYDVVRANHISATTAECVDIKEGTTGGLLEGNVFDGSHGLTAADSWVDVKGDDWHIVDNSGTASPNDGFQTHQIVQGWGTGNVFSGNHSAVDGPGYGIHLTNRTGNIVECDNTATGAGAGTSNVACTPA